MPRAVAKSRYDSDDENYTYRPEASAPADELELETPYRSRSDTKSQLGYLLHTGSKERAVRDKPKITESDVGGETRAEKLKELETQRTNAKTQFRDAERVLDNMDLAEHHHLETMREYFQLITEHLGFIATERAKVMKDKTFRIKKSMSEETKTQTKNQRNKEPMNITGWKIADIKAMVDGEHYKESDFNLCTEDPPAQHEGLDEDGTEIIQSAIMPMWIWFREAKYVLGKRLQHHIESIQAQTSETEAYLNHIKHATEAHDKAYKLELVLRFMREKAHEHAIHEHAAREQAKHEHAHPHQPHPHQPQPTRGKRRNRPAQPGTVPNNTYSTRAQAPTRGRGGKRRRGPGPGAGRDAMNVGD